MTLNVPSQQAPRENSLKPPDSQEPEHRVSFFLPEGGSSRGSADSESSPSSKRKLESSRGSIFDSTSELKRRASHFIIEVPAAQLRRINETEGVGSVKRESKHFSEVNQTGDFTDDLLNYLMEYLTDANQLYGAADRETLHVGQKALDAYVAAHPNFTAYNFFMDAGFECEDMMMLCSFAGRQFNCCQYMTPILTQLGKCYTMDLQSSGKDWMKKQVSSGVDAGLQLFLDAHLEQQFDGTPGDPDPLFTEMYENGFRYYVHPPKAVPYLTSEGISVSPPSRVYSALSTSSYVLLPSERWGNCTARWPTGFHSSLPYSAVNCDSICKADYFNSVCGCSPFSYDIEDVYQMCSPFETVRCIDDNIRKKVNGVDSYNIPKCSLCRMECESVVYHAYNSYGDGFNNGALTWLHKKNPNWSKAHIKSNFVAVNVFFRDMSFTEYEQIQGTTITETLSDIGGNMGMFLGMSLITVAEVLMYFSKVGWLTISKKRRDYMYQKKKHEMEHAKQLEETVTGFKMFRSRKMGSDDPTPAARIRALTRGDIVAPYDDLPKSPSESETDRENEATERRSRFFSTNNGSYYDEDPQQQRGSVVELKVNLRDLEHHDDRICRVKANYCSRPRSSTAPPSRNNF
ncbi:hypothetical protein Q1695_008859 [Nippostrongylus brasiliensis]|nr:hypothetical protein Q1695_008859 [Nippostrongylus brasiliensis]